MARGNAPLPSFPKNKRAWLSLLCSTNSMRCFLTSLCPIISLNSISKYTRDRESLCRYGGILIKILGHFFTHRIHLVVDHCNQFSMFIKQELGKIPFDWILHSHFCGLVYQILKKWMNVIAFNRN